MQDCTLGQVFAGECNLLDMLTGEVFIGLLQTLVAIIAVIVAICQMIKQEHLTREQIKEMQNQLVEMRKTAEPEIDVILTMGDEGEFYIDVINVKDIPVFVRECVVDIKWTIKDYPHQFSYLFSRRHFKSDFYRNAIQFDDRGVLTIGDSYRLVIQDYFFGMLMVSEFVSPIIEYGEVPELTIDNVQSIVVSIIFGISRVDAKVVFKIIQQKNRYFDFLLLGKASPGKSLVSCGLGAFYLLGRMPKITDQNNK